VDCVEVRGKFAGQSLRDPGIGFEYYDTKAHRSS
jgi:hypothetical protein